MIELNLQYFAASAFTGNTPVNAIKFHVNKGGRSGGDEGKVIVKDAESLGMSFDGNVEEWSPMDQEGWVNRMKTSNSITISMGGKRNYGDPGNDYVASLAYEIGQKADSIFYIEFPNGDTLEMPCVIVVTSLGGDSTALDALEWEAHSHGKPTYKKAGTPSEG